MEKRFKAIVDIQSMEKKLNFKNCLIEPQATLTSAVCYFARNEKYPKCLEFLEQK